MTYKPEGIDLEIWRFAKSNKEVSYENLKKLFSEFCGIEQSHISNYSIYETIARTVGDAVENGLIKSHMIHSLATSIHPNPYYAALFHNRDDFELVCLSALLNTLRFVRVKNGSEIFVDL